MVLFILILFIASLFVMSEFVLVRLRASRIDYMIENGNKRAKLLKIMTQNLDKYLSATQLGITITSLAIGWLGDATFVQLFGNLFNLADFPDSISTVVSIVLSFSILTSVQVILGELVPKNIAINKTEQMGLFLAGPLQVWFKLMYPFIYLLNKIANAISRSIGMDALSETEQEAVSEEELRIIMGESLRSGEINRDEYHYVENVFAFDDRMSREIMVPRTDMITVSTDMSLREISQLVSQERYTRYPVVQDGNKDIVLGVINAKQIFSAYVDAVESNLSETFDFSMYIRPAVLVIETIPIKKLLVEMQKERNQIAILVDEYGGTSGMISMEDIVEEIVGDISDDYEVTEEPEFLKLGNHHYRVNARMLIDEINEMFHLSIEEENVDTIGGWMMNKKYDISEGEYLEVGGFVFTVVKTGNSTIETIDIVKQSPES